MGTKQKETSFYGCLKDGALRFTLSTHFIIIIIIIIVIIIIIIITIIIIIGTLWDRVSLCSSVCPRICYVDHKDLKFSGLLASTSQVLPCLASLPTFEAMVIWFCNCCGSQKYPHRVLSWVCTHKLHPPNCRHLGLWLVLNPDHFLKWHDSFEEDDFQILL